MAKKKEYTCVLVETDSEGITWNFWTRKSFGPVEPVSRPVSGKS